MDHDGIITLRAKDISEKVTYMFEIYGNTADCYDKKMRTVKLTLPKYNYFSHYGVCEEIPEFYMCQRYILNDFDGASFYKAVSDYKEKKLAQENELNENGEIKDNNSSIQNANIYLMGMTFKENCPDTRNSRSLDIYKEFKKYFSDSSTCY